jgi:hypothetical protein
VCHRVQAEDSAVAVGDLMGDVEGGKGVYFRDPRQTGRLLL